jgi:hypothetical protein
MDASRLDERKRDEVLAKRSAPAPMSGQLSAVRSEAKKVSKRATGKEAKTERPAGDGEQKAENRRSSSAAVAEATTWFPASSNVAIADAASVLVNAMGRRHRRGRQTADQQHADPPFAH